MYSWLQPHFLHTRNSGDNGFCYVFVSVLHTVLQREALPVLSAGEISEQSAGLGRHGFEYNNALILCNIAANNGYSLNKDTQSCIKTQSICVEAINFSQSARKMASSCCDIAASFSFFDKDVFYFYNSLLWYYNFLCRIFYTVYYYSSIIYIICCWHATFFGYGSRTSFIRIASGITVRILGDGAIVLVIIEGSLVCFLVKTVVLRLLLLPL